MLHVNIQSWVMGWSSLLWVTWMLVVSEGVSYAHDKLKQYNLFDQQGVQTPNIISNTSLSAANNQLSLLSMAVTFATHTNDDDDWFFESVQNIPSFVRNARSQEKEPSRGACQLRLLALAHYSACFRKKMPHMYEGGLASVTVTARVKGEYRERELKCYYITGRNQHFVLVVSE